METINQAPFAILLLGIGGTGKSTTATRLHHLLRHLGYTVHLIRFDEVRKQFAPTSSDPFSRDVSIKERIYDRAAVEFERHLNEARSLIIDSGLSREDIR